MNFYKRHLGDIAKACGHLSQGAMGAYDLLLDWLYANEKALPKQREALHRIGRASTKQERENVDMVIGEFFQSTDDGYMQKRVVLEIAKANAQADTNRRIAVERESRKQATKGARKEHEACNESLNESCTNRTTNDLPSQTPDSRQEQQQIKRTERQAARFAEFWRAYPNPKGKKEALAKWTAKGLDRIADRIIADVQARIAGDKDWMRGFVPHGSTYVNGEGWEDAIIGLNVVGITASTEAFGMAR